MADGGDIALAGIIIDGGKMAEKSTGKSTESEKNMGKTSDCVSNDEGTEAKDDEGASAKDEEGIESKDEDDEGENAKDDEGTESDDEGTESDDEEYEEWLHFIYLFGSDGLRSFELLLLLGLMAIAIEPLFFYVPMMKIKSSTCLGLDKTLMIVVVILRTCVDILHDWSWWPKSSFLPRRRSRGSNLCHDWSWWSKSSFLSRRRSRGSNLCQRLWTWFRKCKFSSPFQWSTIPARVMAIIASLPLPQVIVLALHLQLDLNKWLKVVVLCQFIPRILRIYPTYAVITSNSDMNAWAGAGFNLLLFVLASHAFGGFWYLRAVDRQFACMREACRGHLECSQSSLYCKSGNYADNGFINDICSPEQTLNATTPFDHGLYSDAIKSNLIGSTSFIDKLAHGFWWGLRNLSSMASNLDFHDRVGDTCFAILICISGLILFALLIGNLQVYLQSRMPYKVVKRKWKLEQKRKALEKWGPFSSLPNRLRKEVRKCKHAKWVEVSEVNIESLLDDLPRDLRGKLRKHFRKNLFNQVKEFEELNSTYKNILRRFARPVVYEAGDLIYQKGKPIDKMIHIVEGTVSIYNGNGERTEYKKLEEGDTFGNEMLSSAIKREGGKISFKLLKNDELPRATQTVESKKKVEAFAIASDVIGLIA